MTLSFYDTFFMYTANCIANSSPNSDVATGAVYMQTDDTAYAYNKDFSEKEKQLSKAFDCKPSKFITDETDINFSSTTISKNDANSTSPSLKKSKSLKKLKKIKPQMPTTSQDAHVDHI